MNTFTERVASMAVAHELMTEPQRWLDLGHARLPYWVIGSGPDLVLVHGWPVDGRTWRRIVPVLAEHFTCHVIDLPGAGRSTWTDETPRGCDGLTTCLAQAIEQMDLDARFGLVAFDSGGGFARKVAAQLPERIAGLALGNTETPRDYSRLFLAALRNGRRFGAPDRRSWPRWRAASSSCTRSSPAASPSWSSATSPRYLTPARIEGRPPSSSFAPADFT